MATVSFTVANLTDVVFQTNITTFNSGTSGTLTQPGIALVNSSAGTFTLNLPNSTQISSGQCVIVKQTTNSINSITVTPPSGQIDGLSTGTVSGGSKICHAYMWDGSNWWVMF